MSSARWDTEMRQLEHKEAVLLTRWARIQATAGGPMKWLFAIPNGGLRNKAVAAKMKAEGVQAGVSDYLLPVPSGKYHGLFIELKAPGKTYPTPGQYEFLDDMASLGYAATWCRGFQPAAEAIEAYLRGKDIPRDFRDF